MHNKNVLENVGRTGAFTGGGSVAVAASSTFVGAVAAGAAAAAGAGFVSDVVPVAFYNQIYNKIKFTIFNHHNVSQIEPLPVVGPSSQIDLR